MKRVFISLEWNDGKLGWCLVLRGSSVTIHSLLSWSSPPPTRTRLCCTKACLSHTRARTPCSALPHHCHTLLQPEYASLLSSLPVLFSFHFVLLIQPGWASTVEDVALHTSSLADSECYLLNRKRKRRRLHAGLSGVIKARCRKILGEKLSFPGFPRELACLDLVSPAPCPGLGGCGPPLGGLEGRLRDAKCTTVGNTGRTPTYTGYQGGFSLHKEPLVARES